MIPQVNLDFESEADMVDIMRLSIALQPVATALFANSPFDDGKPSGYLSWRSHVWQRTDPDRCTSRQLSPVSVWLSESNKRSTTGLKLCPGHNKSGDLSLQFVVPVIIAAAGPPSRIPPEHSRVFIWSLLQRLQFCQIFPMSA